MICFSETIRSYLFFDDSHPNVVEATQGHMSFLKSCEPQGLYNRGCHSQRPHTVYRSFRGPGAGHCSCPASTALSRTGRDVPVSWKIPDSLWEEPDSGANACDPAHGPLFQFSTSGIVMYEKDGWSRGRYNLEDRCPIETQS